MLSRTCWKWFWNGHLALDYTRRDKVLYHCQHGYYEMQGCAEKLFNRETVLPVKLFSSRFSMSVPFSLSCRSVLHDKAWSCRSHSGAVSLTVRNSTKAKHFQVSIRFESHSFRDNLFRSYEIQQKSLWLHYQLRVQVQSRVLISSPLWKLIHVLDLLSIHTRIHWELQFQHYLIKALYA